MSAFEADRFNHSRTSPRQNKGFGKSRSLPSLYLPALYLRTFCLHPAISKKILQKLSTLFREHAGNDFHLMIQCRVIQHLQYGFDRTSLGIGSSVDEPGKASLDERTGAHCARFDGDVELTLKQAMISDGSAGVPQSNDFGVGTRVFVCQVAIASARNNLVT